MNLASSSEKSVQKKVNILYYSLVLDLKHNSNLQKKKEIRSICQNLRWLLQAYSPAQF